MKEISHTSTGGPGGRWPAERPVEVWVVGMKLHRVSKFAHDVAKVLDEAGQIAAEYAACLFNLPIC